MTLFGRCGRSPSTTSKLKESFFPLDRSDANDLKIMQSRSALPQRFAKVGLGPSSTAGDAKSWGAWMALGSPRVVFLAKLGDLGAPAFRQSEAELIDDLKHA
jgi:hypothetical protein